MHILGLVTGIGIPNVVLNFELKILNLNHPQKRVIFSIIMSFKRRDKGSNFLRENSQNIKP